MTTLNQIRKYVAASPIAVFREYMRRKAADREHRRLVRELLHANASEHEIEVLVFTETKLSPDEFRGMDLFQRRDWLRAIRDQAKPSTTGDPLSGEEKALAILVKHPDWSDRRIAEHVGCSRTTLYRWSKYVAAREALESGREKFRRTDEL